MTPKASVFIATSLDGYIARPDGNIDWLNEANGLVPEGEDCGYAAFMATIDALVMGRNSFDKVLSFGMWPYGDTPVYVLSSRPLDRPAHVPDTVYQLSGSPADLMQQFAQKGLKHLYIDGGATIQQFLSAGLLDEIILTLIPVVLGSGISLFGDVPADVHLACLDAKQYDFGFVQLKYAVRKA